MKIILAGSAERAMGYAQQNHVGGPGTVFATSPAALAGLAPTEIHVALGCQNCPDFWKILDEVLQAEKKLPIFATWYWDGKLINRDDALERLGVPDRALVGADEADKDAARARAIIGQIDPTTPAATASSLAAVAQVYATLALRRT